MATEQMAQRFRTGGDGYVREWDGHAWLGTRTPDPRVGVLPRKGGKIRGRHRWMGLVFAGMVVGTLLVVVATSGDEANKWMLAIAGFVSSGSVLIAGAWIAWDRLGLSAIADVRRVLALGVLSGLVALGVAFAVEKAQQRIPGPIGSHVGGLFGAGPIEETAKLLVPVLLYFFVGGALRDPRTGFFLAFVSGSVFGAGEGAEYVAGAIHLAHDHHLHDHIGAISEERNAAIVLALTRPAIEFVHPLTTASVAAVAWLIAWRGGKFFSRPAIVTFVIAILYHSVNDGVLAGLLGGHLKLLGTALAFAMALLLFHFVYLPRARQLAPPEVVETNPRRWRPE
ncbi:PrsW family glutamic-type intramembrane protease [Gordonia sp. NPDC058843]|uniref:PrsW family glutamic-type intramembrane protease n=1 Tax=Gordonia sp. NPDC058843 TaxID=3346648 RepID=UPI0036B65FD2